jgi:hypothetical protein
MVCKLNFSPMVHLSSKNKLGKDEIKFIGFYPIIRGRNAR